MNFFSNIIEEDLNLKKNTNYLIIINLILTYLKDV